MLVVFSWGEDVSFSFFSSIYIEESVFLFSGEDGVIFVSFHVHWSCSLAALRVLDFFADLEMGEDLKRSAGFSWPGNLDGSFFRNSIFQELQKL